MKIDERLDRMDFTPYWFVFRSGRPILSEDECTFFGMHWDEMDAYSSPSPAREYARKIVVYYKRFSNHMPIPIRKELLRSIAECQ